MGQIDKNHPAPAWIESLRRKYPIEPQIDQLLVRKLIRRAGPGYHSVGLDTLVNGVTSLLSNRIGAGFHLDNPRWLSGGASKLQMAFDLDWDDPQAGRIRSPMVLRIEPAESIVATSRLREFQLIRAMEGKVPVPRVYWCDEEGEHLPYPGLIYGFSEGVTKPSNTTSGVSGTGIRLSREIRERLAPQFVGHLAAIHSVDYRSADLSAFTAPEPGTQCAQWSVAWWERVWEEDGDEEIPLLRVAAAWLRRHLPVLKDPVLVHSDYRLGNFLFTEHDLRISAVLDWELGRIGDRHQDIAWTTSRTLGGIDDDGEFLVCGMLPEAAFYDAYEDAAGHEINRRTVRWYQVYNNFSLAILLIGSGYRVAINGKTHQDVLVAWLSGLASVVLDQMREQIEEGL